MKASMFWMKGIWWWGYLHSNGNIQVKRWFGDHADYIGDCSGNPFVVKVVKPFEADDREAAYRHIKQEVEKTND